MKEEEIRIDLSIYSLDIIFSSAYALLDKGYFFIDKSSKIEDKEIVIVRFSSKDEDAISTEDLRRDFLDQLINYSVYHSQLKETKETKEYILREVFQSSTKKEMQKKGDIFNTEETIDDPEGILIPWEEKYKNKK